MTGSMNAAPIFMVLVCLAFAGASGSELRWFNWTVEYQKWSPDCASVAGTQVITINGSFPGPTIRAHVGDTIVVNLTNNLQTGEGVVIHWHGIQQRGTPWFDGTASISQCPIQAGKSFEYRFDVEKPGTFFYHGHYGMQRSAGLYGSLIVDVPRDQKEPFDKTTDEIPEFNLLLSDWWHKSSKQQEEDLSSRNFVWIGEPQAILVNGKGQSDCSWEALYDSHSPAPSPSPSPSPSLPLSRRRSCLFTGDEKCGAQSLKVVPNKTYRLRLASSTALASLNLQIQNHKMKVVEADGNYVKPFEVNDMDIYSGESYSVLFTTNQNPHQNYWISLSVRGRKPNTTQSLTLLNYLPTPSSHLPTSPPPIPPLWNNDTHSKDFSESIFAAKHSQLKVPSESNRTLILLNTQNTVDGYKKWAINNVSLLLPENSAILKLMKEGLKGVIDDTSPPDNLTVSYDLRQQAPNPNAKNGSGVYKIEKGHVVDVILQNANALDAGVSEIHPWHLHGHDFWVLGYGDGTYTEKDKENFNLIDPPLRNTVVIFPYGWTALRFVADNPGVWAFHCHIEPHLHMGMGVVFAEAVDSIGKVPPEALVCESSEKIVAVNNGDRPVPISSLFSLFSALAVIFIVFH